MRSSPSTSISTSALFAAGFMKVTQKKILGGNYAFQVLFPAGANNRIQGTEIDQNPGAGLTDSVVQPISLGWHGTRADAIAAYTIYIPYGNVIRTARSTTPAWACGGRNCGPVTTVLFDRSKASITLRAMVSFNFNSKKEDSETKAGNAMYLEGGVGGDFLKGGLIGGSRLLRVVQAVRRPRRRAPWGSWIRGKDRSFALGPEVPAGACATRTLSTDS